MFNVRTSEDLGSVRLHFARRLTALRQLHRRMGSSVILPQNVLLLGDQISGD
jgi:hypothetical protein